MIKFDLHIHSIASKYKESAGIVDDSTIDNIDILLERLNDNEIGLFSITDHNRFDPELYRRLDELIAEGRYTSVKGLVAGVEFDVKLDQDMSKCHIITIFDAKGSYNNYIKIRDEIEKQRIDSQDGFYGKEEYENLLRKIGLDVILIAAQRSGIDRHDGNHNSLSDSTMNSEEFVSTGYINALEFQKPNVEGILKNNMKRIPESVGLVTGSDCHEWSAYPNHDSKQGNPSFHFSRAKILPTFKGLLMAVTSPETRINQQENRNKDYICDFSIDGKKIPLVNGLVAIIGENGSGKSSLLKIINGDAREPYVKEFQNKYNIQCTSKLREHKKLFIKQGQIVEKFSKKSLFSSDNYAAIDHSSFREAYESFARNIYSWIQNRIQASEANEKLKQEELVYDDLMYSKAYFINIQKDADFENGENPHAQHDKQLRDSINTIIEMYENEYYKKYRKELVNAMASLRIIWEEIHSKAVLKKTELVVKNHILSAMADYNRKRLSAATSLEKDMIDYKEKRNEFINKILDAIKKDTLVMSAPMFPETIRGYSSNLKRGFSFNSEASYNNRDVSGDFLARMFVGSFQSIETLESISSLDSFRSAVYRCGSVEQISEVFNRNLNTFLDEMCQETRYIVDVSQQEKAVGNTLGEMSLAFFRYSTENEKDCNIFLVDQPEDHISNKNISQKLRGYFDSIRNKKQVIMVTHNPLLVVNQDVDQVVFLQNSSDRIEVISGCLEYEDENVNILDIVAQNMDGGRESIEKRLKVYGKNNQVINGKK